MQDDERPTRAELGLADAHGAIRIFAPGTEIGSRYEVRSVLGTGGSAVVYEAFDRELRRVVALKVLRGDRMSEGMLKRFRREVAIARDTESPRLVRMWDIGQAGDSIFLTMERVEGESLRARLLRGPLPEDEALRIAAQVLRALSDLHGVGVVHRDVKPGNILLTPDGEVKLADFGLARRWEDDESRVTLTEEFVGTAAYLAPEQALGRAVDARADLYSFGVLLYEMLTGTLPAGELSTFATLMARVNEPAPDIRSVRPSTPAWLAELLLRLLDRKPSARYASAEAVLFDLDARRASRRLVSHARWRTFVIGAAGALAALALGAACLQAWRSRSRFDRLAIEPGVARALDGEGRLLWSRSDVGACAGPLRLEKGARPLVAAVLGTAMDLDPSRNRTLTLLDAETGRVRSRAPLVDGSPSFPGFANRYAVGQVSIADEDGDGRDEVLVHYTHDGLWPSYTVAYDPKSDSSRLVLVATGHHRFVRTLDLGAGRGRVLLFCGPNNLMGWYTGYAAVRAKSSQGDSIAYTPDIEQAHLSGALLWYALGPQYSSDMADPRAVTDAKKGILEMRALTGRVYPLTFGGFDPLAPPKESVEAREAARWEAYEQLRDAQRFSRAGRHPSALAAAAQARALAARAGERYLEEWCRRVQATALASSGDTARADEAFEAMMGSEAASDIAYDAGKTFHLRGDLPSAYRWYRRGLTVSGRPDRGRHPWEHVVGAVLALAEMRRFEEGFAFVEQLDANSPENNVRDVARQFLLWRAGRKPALPLPRLTMGADVTRYWLIELGLAAGAPIERVQRDLESEMARTTETRALLSSAKAEILFRKGHREEAYELADRAAIEIRAAAPRDVYCRGHLSVATERLARIGRSVGARR